MKRGCRWSSLSFTRRLRIWRSTTLLSATKSGPQTVVEDLVPGHDAPSPASQQVQQGLLNRAEGDHGPTYPDLAIGDVNLDLADLHDRDQGPLGPSGPAAEDERPCDQLIGQNGIARMSSTPRPKARNLVARSPRGVRPRAGVKLLVRVFAASSRWSNAVKST